MKPCQVTGLPYRMTSASNLPKISRQNPEFETHYTYQLPIAFTTSPKYLQQFNSVVNFYLPLFTQSVSSNFCGHTLLIKSTKFAFIIYFNEFLTASGWERDVQLRIKMGVGEKKPYENGKTTYEERYREKSSVSSPTQSVESFIPILFTIKHVCA